MLRSAGSPSDLLKARHAFAVAQLEPRRLLIARARKQYNPNQPRVPAGDPEGRRWTGGGSSGVGPRSEYAQLRPRRLPGGYRIIAGRAYEATPAQEARLDITAAQARALVREVQRQDPTWKPRPSLYEGIEGQILANQSEAQQATARLRELGVGEVRAQPLNEVLLPRGSLIGTRDGRASIGTRTVSQSEFRDLLDALSLGAQPIPVPPGYRGLWYQRPDGSAFRLRRSERNGMTIDIIQTSHATINNGDKVHKK